MKLLSLTAAITAISSTAFAGTVSYSSASHDLGVSDAAAMGGGIQWLIPLIVLALIFLSMNSSDKGNLECRVAFDLCDF